MYSQWVEGQAFNESNKDKAVGATIFWSGVIQFFQCLFQHREFVTVTAVKFQIIMMSL